MLAQAPFQHFPYPEIAFKTALSTGIGLLVGLEREWAKKEIGVRTFATAGLLGMIASLFAPAFVIAALCAILVLVAFLNIHSLLKDRSLEMTTSLCLVVVLFLGALVGEGHSFTASTGAIVLMLLLSWKFELERFAGALRPEEIRSAVLLGLLSVVVYPLLPDKYVDPWQLINPRQSWVTVVVIAGIGFVNYVLLRLYGNRGLIYAALLGGLVNSTASVAELSRMFRDRPRDVRRAAGLVLLTNIAMIVRNAAILAIFAWPALLAGGGTLLVMALATIVMVWFRRDHDGEAPAPLQLSSPVSLSRVLRFSALFLAIACVGTLGQRYFGGVGFLVVAILGGAVSSASTTATAAALAATGEISPLTAGLATALASISSSLVNVPIAYQQTRSQPLVRQLSIATAVMLALGAATAWGTWFILH